MLKVDGNRIIAETKTLTAILDSGIITSLVRKSDGEQFIQSNVDKSIPLQLVYHGGEVVPLGAEVGDSVKCLPINDHYAEFRVESWNGDGIISVYEDEENGDLIVEPNGYASRPSLRGVRWTIKGIANNLNLIAPFFQGIKLPLEDPLIRNSYWEWPHRWEAGMAILQGEKGGFWIHCHDNRYRYKALQVGTADDPQCLGLETQVYGPLDNKLSSGGIAWRINVYDGGWQVPAEKYRNWLGDAYKLNNVFRPEWINDVCFAISWCPTDNEILNALADLIDPEKVLLHIPNWRQDAYDENYPSYIPSEKGTEFIQKAQSMGFRTMPHFNSVDMDPTHPAYTYIRDFQYRALDNKRVQGWTWFNGQVKPVPESNSARLKHRDKKTMIKVHPGLGMWRSILAENVRLAVNMLSLKLVFLDVTLCSWNLHNCLVDNVTSTEGMKLLISKVASINDGLIVGGEGRNEITMQDQGFSQVHLFLSWHQSISSLERLESSGLCPLNEFLFGKWCRSFGYANLGGHTPEQYIRMKTHVGLGAIPTITIGSAKEIRQPNPAVKEMLDVAMQK
ncbi:MAG: DUF6259 domain-containing protein [bacterium]